MLAKIFTKLHPPVGARPGYLVINEDAPKPRIHVMNYTPDRVQEIDVDSVEQLRDAFNEDSITWIDVQGFGDKLLMQQIGDLFQFHPLLLEDIVNVPQRPKADEYGDQLLWIVRMVRIDRPGEVDSEQVSIVLGKNYVLTFQERHGDVLDPVRRRLRGGNGPIRHQQADYLAYAIADTIVDGYYPVLELIAERIEDLEEEVILHPTPELLREIHQMKNRLVNLRRGIWPQRDAVNSLVRGDFHGFTDPVRIYLRDTYDHCIQTSEVIEMYREMMTGLMNTYLSSMANRTNEVMKVLTIMASIFIPLTFLAGIYGMNFEYMPELHVKWAYPAVWFTMLFTAAGMIAFFWQKGWISFGRESSRRADRRRQRQS